MCKAERVEVRISPTILLILAVFIFMASSECLAAVLAAVVCHEAGHYLLLLLWGGRVRRVEISAFGVKMEMQDSDRLSYSREIAAVAAGPGMNLIVAVFLLRLAGGGETSCLFAGAQLVLGGFNLLPLAILDGGRLLWLVVSYFFDPNLADRVAGGANMGCMLLLMGIGIWVQATTGMPFLLIAAFGGLWLTFREMGLAKRREKG